MVVMGARRGHTAVRSVFGACHVRRGPQVGTEVVDDRASPRCQFRPGDAPVKLLVLGGAGYIGSVVAARLVEAGHDVTVGDNLLRGHRDAVPSGAQFELVDIEDRSSVSRVLAPGFDGVFHFAALTLVGESVRQPTRYFRVNVLGSLNVLDAMAESEVKRLVFSSTAAVYGEPDAIPVTEAAPTRPTNPYGASKLAVDSAIAFQAAATDLSAVSLRYFNVAGAHGPLGERHDPETHLIPLVLAAAAARRPTVSIFGTDYATPDGTAIRDYLHVDDLADAHLLAMESLSSPGHRTFNLGNGSGYSVREVIAAAELITGMHVPVVEEARRAGDPAVLVASAERIRRDLGWIPRTPELPRIVADAWAFETAQTCRS
jgi:UDP-glucose 4-epimerase